MELFQKASVTHSTVSEISEQIAESWFRNATSGARNTSGEVAVCMSVLKNVSHYHTKDIIFGLWMQK